MREYKVVPFAGKIVVKGNVVPQQAVQNYFEIINQEALAGWIFQSCIPLTVCQKINRKTMFEVPYNALVFYKEV